ncbi:TIGR04104 family putative zinc finger protein [Virgibacillus flavescens]|uniref:TIGR04104 family putative zinc finger protein n=1 Tax=Virgibacillus flavescens TaxID=1611422 RepID=UPI003D354F50
MQTCEECNVQFSRNKIYKSVWWKYKPITCENCGTTHRITFLGRITVGSLTILPMSIFLNFLSPFSSSIVTLGIGLLILFVGFLMIPFFVTYKESASCNQNG